MSWGHIQEHHASERGYAICHDGISCYSGHMRERGNDMKTTPKLEDQLRKYASKGVITPRKENNQYLKVFYKGSGGLISEKWNVKIYSSGKVVCVDHDVLNDILEDALKEPDDSKIVLKVDDAGWGFALCGAAVGVSDDKRVEVDFVDVSYFQDPAFTNKEYLREYTRKGYNLIVDWFQAKPETHRIEICSGYLNQPLRAYLRDRGFEVRVVDIRGLLQDRLEDLFKQHVKEKVGRDLAYDPKELGDARKIAKKFYEVVEWGRENCPHLLKTGWKSLGQMPKRRAYE